jgi:hypothetical protein
MNTDDLMEKARQYIMGSRGVGYYPDRAQIFALLAIANELKRANDIETALFEYKNNHKLPTKRY